MQSELSHSCGTNVPGNAEGANKRGAAIGCGVGLGLTVLPFVGFAFLAIKGGQAIVPANTLMNGIMVSNDYTIAD